MSSEHDELAAKIDKAAASIARSINTAVGVPEDRDSILLSADAFVAVLEALRRAAIPLLANLTEDEFDATSKHSKTIGNSGWSG